MKIAPPKSPSSVSAVDCQHALGDVFHDIVIQAENAGWSKVEIAVALRELSEAHIMDLISRDEDMERQITAALRASA